VARDLFGECIAVAISHDASEFGVTTGPQAVGAVEANEQAVADGVLLEDARVGVDQGERKFGQIRMEHLVERVASRTANTYDFYANRS
jgi:hypothetical protein